MGHRLFELSHDAQLVGGRQLTTVGGNGNLCLSCHVIGGLCRGGCLLSPPTRRCRRPGCPQARRPRAPRTGGTAGAAGHVAPDLRKHLTGRSRSRWDLLRQVPQDLHPDDHRNRGGRYRRLLLERHPGWRRIRVTTGVDVPLNDGVTASFVDGESPPSFVAGDVWRIFVRTDLRPPTTTAMSSRLEDGRAMCSTCHNQHNQSRVPFDSAAPAIRWRRDR